jgi:hypothetical protein
MIRRDPYTDEDWVDFVRGTVATERHDAMQQHLESGCATCRDAHDTWKAVLGACRQEPGFEPPAAAVRLARLVYAATRPRRGSAAAETTLLFDSRSATAAVGLRAVRPGPRPRKLLYKNGEFLVDLQLETSETRSKSVLTGQVMELEKAELHVAGLLVVLLQQRKLVGRTTTNSFGEFSLEFDGSGDGLALAVEINHKAMIIALDDLTKVPS